MRPGLIVRRTSALLALVLLGCGNSSENPLARDGAGGRFAGTYQNDGMRVDLAGGPDGYTGTLSFRGRSYDVAAKESGQRLAGSFGDGSGRFDFEASLAGSDLKLTSGGVEHVLARQGNPNPLAAGGTSASAGRPLPAQAAGTSQPPNARPEAAEVESGRTTRAGTSFVLPEGWRIVEDKEGVALVPPGTTFDPAATDNPEIYTLSSSTDHRNPLDAELHSQLLESWKELGIIEAQGNPSLQRFPVPGGSAAVYSIRGVGAASQKPTAIHAYLVPGAGGICMLLAIGEPGRVDPRDAVLRRIASSLRFEGDAQTSTGESSSAGPEGPRAGTSRKSSEEGAVTHDSPLSDGHPLSEQWQAHLANNRMAQINSYAPGDGGGVMSSSADLYLNADGSFEFSSSSSATINSGDMSASGGGQSGSGGRWHIRTKDEITYLVLTREDGHVEHGRLEMSEGKTYFNGQRWFVVPR